MRSFEDVVLLSPREVPLGGPRGMTVHRTLPARQTSLIGAWCFVDHFGPNDVSLGDGMRVARHPHTGLATVSWLFEGAITHRDSIGNHALVRPGDVDLMVAGSGISHSEFSTRDTTVLHGVQLWYALPDRARFREQEFAVHTPEELTSAAVNVRVGLGHFRATDDAGEVLEDRSPLATDTQLSMTQIDVQAGHHLRIELDPAHEYGVLVDRGTAHVSTRSVGSGWASAAPLSAAPLNPQRGEATVQRAELAVLPDGADHLVLLAADGEDLRVMLLGGEPLQEDIIMWWNFVGRTHEEIEQFRARYQAEIGVEYRRADAPIAEIVRERGGLGPRDEQFGPFAPHTPKALPAPMLPNGRLRSRGRVGRPTA